MKIFHTLIIGSGLIGSTAAIALAQKNVGNIAILDARKSIVPTNDNILDTRTLALNYASVDYLTSLGLWKDLTEHACPIQQVHISEKGAFGSCRLNAGQVGHDSLGHIVEIKNLHSVLLQHLADYSAITTMHEAQVQSLEKIASHWQVKIKADDQMKTLIAENIILADGTQSQLREQLGIQCETFDYQQTAIVAVAACSESHQNCAYERFAGVHKLAILPLTKNRVGTVLVVPNEEAKNFLALDDKNYCHQLQKLLSFRLGSFTALGPRQHYPLKEVIAHKFTLDNLVLLGNTAHTLNPIGAQGLNLGLAGLKDYAQHGMDTFKKNQRTRCDRLQKLTRETAKVFASEACLTGFARNVGLLTLQYCNDAKARFTRRMMGLA